MRGNNVPESRFSILAGTATSATAAAEERTADTPPQATHVRERILAVSRSVAPEATSMSITMHVCISKAGGLRSLLRDLPLQLLAPSSRPGALVDAAMHNTCCRLRGSGSGANSLLLAGSLLLLRRVLLLLLRGSARSGAARSWLLGSCFPGLGPAPLGLLRLCPLAQQLHPLLGRPGRHHQALRVQLGRCPDHGAAPRPLPRLLRLLRCLLRMPGMRLLAVVTLFQPLLRCRCSLPAAIQLRRAERQRAVGRAAEAGGGGSCGGCGGRCCIVRHKLAAGRVVGAPLPHAGVAVQACTTGRRGGGGGRDKRPQSGCSRWPGWANSALAKSACPAVPASLAVSRRSVQRRSFRPWAPVAPLGSLLSTSP